MALLTFGEGWHNNHHAYPVSARHGLKWYEIDFNWYGIWILKQLGLASHIYRAKLPARTHPSGSLALHRGTVKSVANQPTVLGETR